MGQSVIQTHDFELCQYNSLLLRIKSDFFLRGSDDGGITYLVKLQRTNKLYNSAHGCLIVFSLSRDLVSRP